MPQIKLTKATRYAGRFYPEGEQHVSDGLAVTLCDHLKVASRVKDGAPSTAPAAYKLAETDDTVTLTPPPAAKVAPAADAADGEADDAADAEEAADESAASEEA